MLHATAFFPSDATSQSFFLQRYLERAFNRRRSDQTVASAFAVKRHSDSLVSLRFMRGINKHASCPRLPGGVSAPSAPYFLGFPRRGRARWPLGKKFIFYSDLVGDRLGDKVGFGCIGRNLAEIEKLTAFFC